MDTGLILALLSGFTFAINAVFLRRVLYQTGESFLAVVISVFIGVLFFSVPIFINGEWGILRSASGQAIILLAAAGITHFILGRWAFYQSVRLVGANRGIAISRTQMFYAVILGIVLLNEPLTGFLVLGVLCIAAGATLVSIQRGNETTKMHSSGILVGLGGAFVWGITGVLVKPALTELGSPYVGGFISCVAAAVVLGGFCFRQKLREQIRQLTGKTFLLLGVNAILISTAQLLRYAAFNYSPVSLVTPLIGTSGIFTFFLSYLLNRNIEVSNWKVFLGTVTTVAGTFLLFY